VIAQLRRGSRPRAQNQTVMIETSEKRVDLAKGGERLVRKRELAGGPASGGLRDIAAKRKRSLDDNDEDDCKTCPAHDPAAGLCSRAKRT
jgi:hypothetical protein